MGRKRSAYKLDERDNGIWYVVGTTPDGRRVHRLVLRNYPESKGAEESVARQLNSETKGL